VIFSARWFFPKATVSRYGFPIQELPLYIRFFAFILFIGFAAVSGWLGLDMWNKLGSALPPARSAQAIIPSADLTQTSAQPPARRWPSLFGVAVKNEPQPPQPAPVSAQPPLENMGYKLQGIVHSGDSQWAIVSHPTGDILLRQGDTLIDGVIVTEINAEGLWVSQNGIPVLVEFERQDP
jgi:hypothetical protein